MKTNQIVKRMLPVLALTFAWVIAMPASASLQNSDTVCHVTAPQKVGTECKNYDMLLFAPTSTMDLRNMSILAALVCDFRYEHAITDTTLVCVFTDARKAQWSYYGIDQKKLSLNK